MSATNENLPRGDRWSAFDVLSWMTFGEVRAATDNYEFREKPWTRDWKRWPPEWLAFAFQEMDTGIPWQPDLEEIGPFGPDNQREWARRIIADTGASAGQLLRDLMKDIKRYRAIQDRWTQSKAGVNEAMRRGEIRVWGVQALAPSRPDPDGVHKLLDPLIFTETRGVNESSWIDWTHDGLGFIDYDGPSYDRVFFDSAEVKIRWPATARVQPGTLEWLTSTAETFLAERGGKPMRDDLVKDCVALTKVSTREAEAAYKLLPDRLRRKRGDRDR